MRTAEEEQSERGPRARVFISYSRKDQPFVERLAASLEERGLSMDWDQATADPENVSRGIAAEDEWWRRLQELIAAADVMVFVVSPNSAGSRVCDEEIAYARALGKRVIAILYRTIDFDKAPPRLAALNVKISFVGDAVVYDESLDELTRALSLDVGWMRESTRLAQAAHRWNAAQRERDLLLQGTELRAVEKWMARRPTTGEPPSEIVLDFIEASRDAEEERSMISEAQRIRYQEIERVTRVLLEEELSVRESLPRSPHPGVADEESKEQELLRSLLGLQNRWHPQRARWLGSDGASRGYAEYFEFPCCGKKVRDFLATGDSDPVSQFRADGCEEIPESIQYESLKPSNPFGSVLVNHYRRLTSGEGSATQPSEGSR